MQLHIHKLSSEQASTCASRRANSSGVRSTGLLGAIIASAGWLGLK